MKLPSIFRKVVYIARPVELSQPTAEQTVIQQQQPDTHWEDVAIVSDSGTYRFITTYSDGSHEIGKPFEHEES